MKLVELYIINFGNLSNVTYKFNEDITSFCEKNGYGKSTLVDFIKAMFYGMETYTKRSVTFLDREHYYPFSGGTFGGNITFIYKDHTYRIERTFDIKSGTSDTLKVYKDNKETSELGEIPGDTIFGITKESFERLIIINADRIKLESSNDISKKLNNYASNVSEDFDIDDVISKAKALKKEQSEKVKELKEKIANLKTEITNLEGIKESLDSKYALLNEAERSYKQVSEELDKARKLSFILDRWERYDELEKEVKEIKEKINRLQGQYKNGLPNKEEVQEIKQSFQFISINEASIANTSVDVSQQIEFNNLKNKYQEYLPSEEDIKDIESKINKIKLLKEERNNLTNKAGDDEQERLARHFSNNIVPDEEIEKIQNEFDEYNRLANELQNINPNVTEEVSTKSNRTSLFIILGLSIVLLGVGIGLVFVNLIVGIILISLGAVALFISIVLLMKKSLENKINLSSKPNETYNDAKGKLDKKKSDVLILLAQYKYLGDDVTSLFYEFKNDVQRNNTLLSDNSSNESRITEIDREINELNEIIINFFNKVHINPSNFDVALDTLKKELSRLSFLKEMMDKSNNKKAEINNLINAEKEKIKKFYEKYSISKDKTIEDIEKDVSEFERLNNELKTKSNNRDKYKEDNNLTERPINKQYDIDALNSRYNLLFEEYKNIKEEVDELEEDVSRLDDLRSDLERLIEERSDAEFLSSVYENIKKEITSANESLVNKYVAPIRDRFIYYAELLEKAIGEKVFMDKNFKITFDREGALRKSDHLSSGLLAICALCFRLALLDNMFEGEDIFVILDDTFLTLDAEHLEKAKNLILELSKNKQILYFTCHESRRI